jgi:hypothetical protein
VFSIDLLLGRYNGLPSNSTQYQSISGQIGQLVSPACDETTWNLLAGDFLLVISKMPRRTRGSVYDVVG